MKKAMHSFRLLLCGGVSCPSEFFVWYGSMLLNSNYLLLALNLRFLCTQKTSGRYIFANFARMSRIMAIDYGRKRTGIAVTDTGRIIAQGLTTVATHMLTEFLKGYFAKEKVGLVLIGLPKQNNGEPSENEARVRAFAKGFEKAFPDIPYKFYDERFTSVLAHRAMIEGGLKKSDRRNKALVDEISATIILQSYLEANNNTFI